MHVHIRKTFIEVTDSEDEDAKECFPIKRTVSAPALFGCLGSSEQPAAPREAITSSSPALLASTPNSRSSGRTLTSQEVDASADGKTTVLLRNIPTSYTREMLMEMLDREGFFACYDFLYLPIKFKKKVVFGYAFVNLVNPQCARSFRAHFSGFSRWEVPHAKSAEVDWTKDFQGYDQQVERYRNSPLQAQERRPSGVHGRTQERRPSGVHGRTQERRPSGVHGRTQERRPSAATPATLSSPPSHEQAHAHASQGNAPPPDHEAPQLPQSAMQRQSTPPTPTATHTRQCSLDQSDVQLVAATDSASLRNAAPTTDSASLKNAAPEEGTTDEPVFESPQQWQRFQSGMVRRSSALGWRAARHVVMDECSEPPNPYLCSGAFSCMALRFADTGSFLAGTFFDGSLRIYDASRASRLHTVQVRTGGVVAKRQGEEERTGSATEEERNLGRIRANRNIATEVALTNVRWRLDRRGERILATTTSDGYIVLFGVNAAGIPTRLSCTTESPHSLSALAFNADGTRLVVGGADRVVRVHDVEVAKTVSGLRRCDKTIEGHVSRVVSLVAHPINPQVAFSGGLDHRIFTWDFRDRRHKRRMTTGVVLAGDALDVSKDGSSLIVGCHREERQIQIYDVRMDTAAVSALDVPGAASSRGAPSSETVHRKSSNLEPLMQRFGPRLRSSYHWAGDVDAVCRSTRPMTTLLFSLAWDSQTKLVATAGEKDNFAGILHVKNTEDEAGSAGVVETFYGKDTAFTYAAIDNDGLNAAFGCADGAVLFAKTQRA